MEEKKPNGLIALCILSWISIAYQVLSVSMSISAGPPTDEMIEAAKIQALEGQTAETIEAMRWVIEDTEVISKVQQENFALITSVDVIGLLVGLIAVILMFRLRKIGFHLYIIYTLISIGYWTYFYSGLNSSGAIIGMTSAIGIIFVALYAVQSKKMA